MVIEPAKNTSAEPETPPAVSTRAVRISRLRKEAEAVGDRIEMVVFPRAPKQHADRKPFGRTLPGFLGNVLSTGLLVLSTYWCVRGAVSGVASMDASGIFHMIDAFLYAAFCGFMATAFGTFAFYLVREQYTVVRDVVPRFRRAKRRGYTQATAETEGDIWAVGDAGIYMSRADGDEKLVRYVSISEIGRDDDERGDLYFAVSGFNYFWITGAVTDDGRHPYHIVACLNRKWTYARSRRGLRLVI